MKKSILMAIVAVALLAAPAFAGDYSIVANIDWGFGGSLGTADQVANADLPATSITGVNNVVTNDYTQLAFTGQIDDYSTLSILTEYGSSGGGGQIAGALNVQVTDFNLTTDLLGAMGVTDIPVTLSLSAGHGRLNMHNRFQQWTGWEIKRWKNYGAAHFAGKSNYKLEQNAGPDDIMGTADDTVDASAYGPWDRANYVKLTVGIMDMVNIAFGFVPEFNSGYMNSDGDLVKATPMMIEVWTSGIAVGPAALDIAANLRADGYEIAAGAQVTANMNFGALGLTAFVGEDYTTSTDSDLLEGSSNGLYVAVKPSYNFGAGSVALGVWFGMTTVSDGYISGGSAYKTVTPTDDASIMDLAVDLSLSYATFTLYGGVIMHDLSDTAEDDDSPMKYDIGVKNSFGAATLSLGVTGVAGIDTASTNGVGALNDFDIGAADGTGSVWADKDSTDVAFLPTLYFRVQAWY